ncbi:tryptophanyl-tRNA synthetase [Eremomyces bilateralis CBS 781.70]|uniref:tryptophan--tRNA ligase n=1 Tax=Eremomyces bilateralis CBS 781.70 TaxID=1392243 RepID=A0A6G1G5P2_9PEZI|nr:tryptophanyl-tRNA synthetase [Eremomyces bilateralis CBS 781.70]KAF1813200.1 tryptophanyl-tRNA synthetase [Eremomyces bilateralis CBS 781.70]
MDPAPRPSRKKRPPRVVFSGIQPTGIPHLGNYLGALAPWRQIQRDAVPDDVLLFSIVDMHALTTRPEPEKLRKRSWRGLASLLAVGITPETRMERGVQVGVFFQNQLPRRMELMWILSCLTSMGNLSRMTQWKSARAAQKLGLFSYPVLQAADILIHGATHVPVGEDQAQHLEFARDLADTFNHLYSPTKPILLPPQTLISPAKRVRSLTDPARKMSKSDPSDWSRILLTDSPEVIQEKIRYATTDSIQGGTSYDPVHRPGIANLIDILTWMYELKLRREGRNYDFAELKADTIKFAVPMRLKLLKGVVAQAVSDELMPFRVKYEWLTKSPDGRRELQEARWAGGKMATLGTALKLSEVREAVGLVRSRDEPHADDF